MDRIAFETLQDNGSLFFPLVSWSLLCLLTIPWSNLLLSFHLERQLPSLFPSPFFLPALTFFLCFSLLFRRWSMLCNTWFLSCRETEVWGLFMSSGQFFSPQVYVAFLNLNFDVQISPGYGQRCLMILLNMLWPCFSWLKFWLTKGHFLLSF